MSWFGLEEDGKEDKVTCSTRRWR